MNTLKGWNSNLDKFDKALYHTDARGNRNVVGTSKNVYGIGNEKRTINKFFSSQMPREKSPTDILRENGIRGKVARGRYASDIHETHATSIDNTYDNTSAIKRTKWTVQKGFNISKKGGWGGYKDNLGL